MIFSEGCKTIRKFSGWDDLDPGGQWVGTGHRGNDEGVVRFQVGQSGPEPLAQSGGAGKFDFKCHALIPPFCDNIQFRAVKQRKKRPQQTVKVENMDTVDTLALRACANALARVVLPDCRGPSRATAGNSFSARSAIGKSFLGIIRAY
jgi:hypothetical protein